MVVKSPRVRLDELLVQRGLAPSRSQARALVLAGRVRVPGVAHTKPGLLLTDGVVIDVATTPTYVSRGGVKLAHALEHFAIDPTGWVCADIGASTGGFSDCLLQRGAQRVYAIDVGYGQLDWRLRIDPRVVVMERTNARYLEPLPDQIALAVVDASFISLRLLLPPIASLLGPGGSIVGLVKPQFEAGRERVARGGVVRDPAVHAAVLESVASWLGASGLGLRGLVASPLRGPAGNVEFLAHIGPARESDGEVQPMIDEALAGVSQVPEGAV